MYIELSIGKNSQVFCNDKRKIMQWADLGVEISQGNQRAKQGKWLHQATWSKGKA